MPLIQHVTAPTVGCSISAAVWTAGLLFVLGACIGSFLNVVIYRIPAGLSLVSPPSRCPACQTPIRAFDNVPILSWILLRGRCRNCRTSIPIRYALVELGTAILFAVIGWTRLSPSASVVATRDLIGELTQAIGASGQSILIGLIAASLLVVAVCWLLDRVRAGYRFLTVATMTVVVAVVTSPHRSEALLVVAVGAVAGLLIGYAIRRWKGRGVWRDLAWQNMLVVGGLAAVVLAVR